MAFTLSYGLILGSILVYKSSTSHRYRVQARDFVTLLSQIYTAIFLSPHPQPSGFIILLLSAPISFCELYPYQLGEQVLPHVIELFRREVDRIK